jgi:hypothetical protein
MVIFHKYFLFVKKFSSSLDKYLACASCIFIATKVCNQLIPLKILIKNFYKKYKEIIKNDNINIDLIQIDDQLICETGDKICMIEFDIINYIGFDLNIELPYKYINMLKSYFIDYLKNPKYIVATNRFINDSFKLPLCIYYDPIYIALGSMYLLSVWLKVDLVNTKEGKKWYRLISEKNVKFEKIISVSEKINNIYKFVRNKSEMVIIKDNKEKKQNSEDIILNFEPTDSLIRVKQKDYMKKCILHSLENVVDINTKNVDDYENNDYLRINKVVLNANLLTTVTIKTDVSETSNIQEING